MYLSARVLIEAICRVGNSSGSQPTVGQTHTNAGGRFPALSERTRTGFRAARRFLLRYTFWAARSGCPLGANADITRRRLGRSHVCGGRTGLGLSPVPDAASWQAGGVRRLSNRLFHWIAIAPFKQSYRQAAGGNTSQLLRGWCCSAGSECGRMHRSCTASIL